MRELGGLARRMGNERAQAGKDLVSTEATTTGDGNQVASGKNLTQESTGRDRNEGVVVNVARNGEDLTRQDLYNELRHQRHEQGVTLGYIYELRADMRVIKGWIIMVSLALILAIAAGMIAWYGNSKEDHELRQQFYEYRNRAPVGPE